LLSDSTLIPSLHTLTSFPFLHKQAGSLFYSPLPDEQEI
jgi:hypothetical protein